MANPFDALKKKVAAAQKTATRKPAKKKIVTFKKGTSAKAGIGAKGGGKVGVAKRPPTKKPVARKPMPKLTGKTSMGSNGKGTVKLKNGEVWSTIATAPKGWSYLNAGKDSVGQADLRRWRNIEKINKAVREGKITKQSQVDDMVAYEQEAFKANVKAITKSVTAQQKYEAKQREKAKPKGFDKFMNNYVGKPFKAVGNQFKKDLFTGEYSPGHLLKEGFNKADEIKDNAFDSSVGRKLHLDDIESQAMKVKKITNPIGLDDVVEGLSRGRYATAGVQDTWNKIDKNPKKSNPFIKYLDKGIDSVPGIGVFNQLFRFSNAGKSVFDPVEDFKISDFSKLGDSAWAGATGKNKLTGVNVVQNVAKADGKNNAFDKSRWLQAGAGLTGDFAFDPLNVVGVGKVSSFKNLTKLTKAEKIDAIASQQRLDTVADFLVKQKIPRTGYGSSEFGKQVDALKGTSEHLTLKEIKSLMGGAVPKRYKSAEAQQAAYNKARVTVDEFTRGLAAKPAVRKSAEYKKQMTAMEAVAADLRAERTRILNNSAKAGYTDEVIEGMRKDVQAGRLPESAIDNFDSKLELPAVRDAVASHGKYMSRNKAKTRASYADYTDRIDKSNKVAVANGRSPKKALSYTDWLAEHPRFNESIGKTLGSDARLKDVDHEKVLDKAKLSLKDSNPDYVANIERRAEINSLLHGKDGEKGLYSQREKVKQALSSAPGEPELVARLTKLNKEIKTLESDKRGLLQEANELEGAAFLKATNSNLDERINYTNPEQADHLKNIIDEVEARREKIAPKPKSHDAKAAKALRDSITRDTLKIKKLQSDLTTVKRRIAEGIDRLRPHAREKKLRQAIRLNNKKLNETAPKAHVQLMAERTKLQGEVSTYAKTSAKDDLEFNWVKDRYERVSKELEGLTKTKLGREEIIALTDDASKGNKTARRMRDHSTYLQGIKNSSRIQLDRMKAARKVHTDKIARIKAIDEQIIATASAPRKKLISEIHQAEAELSRIGSKIENNPAIKAENAKRIKLEDEIAALNKSIETSKVELRKVANVPETNAEDVMSSAKYMDDTTREDELFAKTPYYIDDDINYTRAEDDVDSALDDAAPDANSLGTQTTSKSEKEFEKLSEFDLGKPGSNIKTLFDKYSLDDIQRAADHQLEALVSPVGKLDREWLIKPPAFKAGGPLENAPLTSSDGKALLKYTNDTQHMVVRTTEIEKSLGRVLTMEEKRWLNAVAKRLNKGLKGDEAARRATIHDNLKVLAKDLEDLAVLDYVKPESVPFSTGGTVEGMHKVLNAEAKREALAEIAPLREALKGTEGLEARQIQAQIKAVEEQYKRVRRNYMQAERRAKAKRLEISQMLEEETTLRILDASIKGPSKGVGLKLFGKDVVKIVAPEELIAAANSAPVIKQISQLYQKMLEPATTMSLTAQGARVKLLNRPAGVLRMTRDDYNAAFSKVSPDLANSIFVAKMNGGTISQAYKEFDDFLETEVRDLLGAFTRQWKASDGGALTWDEIGQFLPEQLSVSNRMKNAMHPKMSTQDFLKSFGTGAGGTGTDNALEFLWKTRVAVEQAKGLRAMKATITKEMGIPLGAGKHSTLTQQAIDELQRNGWKTVPGLKINGQATHIFHPSVQRDINRLMEMFATPEKRTQLTQLFDEVTRGWKMYATIYNPGYYPRNFIGETIIGAIAGVTNPKWYKHSATMLAFRHKGEGGVGALKSQDALGAYSRSPELHSPVGKKNSNPVFFTRPDGEKITAEKALVLASDEGLNTGFINTTLDEGAESVGHVSRYDLQSKPILKAIPKMHEKVRKAGEVGEDFPRFAHFLYALNKAPRHMNLKQAAQWAANDVKHFHFDYSDATKFETNVMMRAFPFYKWTRKAVPVITAQLFLNPSKMMWYPKTMTALSSGLVEGYADEKNGFVPNYADSVPDYLKNMLAYPIGTDEEGHDTYLNIQTPQWDGLKALLDPGNVASLMSNPIVKMPYEQIMDKPLVDYGDPGFDSSQDRYSNMMGILPQGKFVDKLINRKDGALKENGAVDETALSFVTGLGFYEDMKIKNYGSAEAYFKANPDKMPKAMREFKDRDEFINQKTGSFDMEGYYKKYPDRKTPKMIKAEAKQAEFIRKYKNRPGYFNLGQYYQDHPNKFPYGRPRNQYVVDKPYFKLDRE